MGEKITDRALQAAARGVLDEFNLPDGDLGAIAGQVWAKFDEATRSELSGMACISDAERGQILKAICTFQATAQNKMPYDLFTFSAAAHCPEKPKAKIAHVLAALDSDLGRMQLQSLTCLAPPAPSGADISSDKVVCGFTGIFAAGADTAKSSPISPQALRRREVGRKGKTGFYSKVLSMAGADAQRLEGKGLCAGGKRAVEDALGAIRSALPLLGGGIKEFANDFEEIVATPPDGLSLSLKSNLCVLNMDGNNFGKLRAAQEDFIGLQTLSLYLDVLKAGLLAKLIIWVGERAMDGATARFETLLWGGDEFTFVAPSWVGWDMAAHLQDCIMGWVEPFSGARLTFGTGVVFGPHNTPIRDLTRAAGELCDLAKHDRSLSLIQTIAYEGIDRTQLSAVSFRRLWLGGDVPAEPFSYSSAGWNAVAETKQRVLKGVGRSALHKWHLVYKYLLLEESIRLNDQRLEAWKKDIERIGRFEAGDAPLSALGISTDDIHATYPFLAFGQMCLMLDYIKPEVV